MALIAGMATLSAVAQKPCKVEGQLSSDFKSEKIYIYVSNVAEESKDSAVVKKGKFSYISKANGICRARFVPVVDNGKGVSMKQTSLILVPGEKAVLDISQKGSTVSGSELYKQWGAADKVITEATHTLTDFVRQFQKDIEGKSQEEVLSLQEKARSKYQELNENYTQTLQDYLEQHCGESGCLLYYACKVGDATQAYEKANEVQRHSEAGKFIKRLADEERAREEARAKQEAEAKKAEEASAEGQMFIDFECEYNGKVQKLSDYVGKGKYVLVDFWASWCGPCKAEIPNLINVYNRYKGEKFEVLGVATWDKPKDTEKAVQQMNIPYPQIINAQKAGSDAYGIVGIPQIILFGPDGKIIKRNLRGEAVEAEVKKCLEQ